MNNFSINRRKLFNICIYRGVEHLFKFQYILVLKTELAVLKLLIKNKYPWTIRNFTHINLIEILT